MLNSAIVLAAEGHHVVNELPIPPVWYGIITFIGLMLLLVVFMSMRSVGLRPAEPGQDLVQGGDAHGHGGHHGH